MKRINPNIITGLRLFVFAPLVCFFLMHGYLVLALLSMILGEITDGLDGFFARRYGRVSDFGKLFDPMCDSFFHIIIWLSFLKLGWVPIYFVILFFGRDLVVSYIRIWLASQKEKIILAARISGKIKAVAQATAQISIVFSHLFLSRNILENIQRWLVLLAAGVTIYSLLDYGISSCVRIRQIKERALAELEIK